MLLTFGDHLQDVGVKFVRLPVATDIVEDDWSHDCIQNYQTLLQT